MSTYRDEFSFTGGSGHDLEGFDFGDEAEPSAFGSYLDDSMLQVDLPEGFLDDETYADDLPSSVTRAEDEVFDLSAMLAEGADWDDDAIHKSADLADLDWLDPTLGQDPDRLPKNPVDRGRAELEAAWGASKGTNGLRLVPGKTDKEVADHLRSIRSGPKSGVPVGDGGTSKAARAARLVDAARHAMRRSAYGDPIPEILREAVDTQGVDAHALRASMDLVRAEHGLAGRVFIRAAAFPGLLNGQWHKAIQRNCRTARYILAQAGTPLAQYENFLGRKVVTEVPWKGAWAFYSKRAVSGGVKVASSPRTSEQCRLALHALLDQAPDVYVVASHKPIEARPADSVSADAARTALHAAPATARTVVNHDARDADRKMTAARNQVARWRDAGLLDRRDADALLLSQAPAKAVMVAALQIIQASGRQAAYAGSGTLMPKVRVATRKEALASLAVAAQNARAAQDDVARIDRERLGHKIEAMVGGGLLLRREADVILKSASTHEQAIAAAFTCVSRRALSKSAIPQSLAKAARYGGDGVGAIPENKLSRGQAGRLLHASKDPHAGVPAALAARDLKLARDHVAALRAAGLLSDKEADRLARAGTGLAETLATASVLVARRQASPSPVGVSSSPVAAYAGDGLGARPTFQDMDPIQAWAALSKSAGDVRVSTLEVRSIVKWARQQMSEGVAGRELDMLLRVRFAGPVLKAAADKLAEVRGAHEGLSGFLYADAAAYASKEGTSGCDKGALRHRANQLKVLMAMDRCKGCAFANKTADGTVVCQKYNKAVVATPPVKNPAAYQAATLRLANTSDAEQTAGMFANSYDQSEYGLGNGELDGEIDFNDLALPAEELGQILYGGMEL